MTKFDDKKQQQDEERIKQDYINNLLLYVAENSTSKATRVIDNFLGQVKLRSGVIDIYETKHYTGNTEKIEDGIYEYSRFTATIGGVRISQDSYQRLMNVLAVIG